MNGVVIMEGLVPRHGHSLCRSSVYSYIYSPLLFPNWMMVLDALLGLLARECDLLSTRYVPVKELAGV